MQEKLKPSQEHLIRKEKVAQLAERGIDAWPESRHVDTTLQQAHDHFTAHEDQEHVVTLAGRILGIRGHGKALFIDLRDRSGRMQLYVRKDVITPELFALVTDHFDIGDIIWITGTLFRTRVGEVTVRVTDIALLSKCLHPLPEKYHGLHDTEQRYRQRYLDTMVNQESRTKFLQRSHIIQEIRTQLLQRDFLEVETPMLHTIPGGAAARPFTTKHNAYNMDLYLRIAPELYLKRLVVGGFDRVFEINRNFRNEGVSTRHNPEFTMLELYMAYGDYKAGMALTEKLFHAVAHRIHGTAKIPYGEHEIDFESSFARYSIKESLVALGGLTAQSITPDAIDTILNSSEQLREYTTRSYGEKLLALFEEYVEHRLIQPTFITDYPVEVSPLAKQHAHDSSVTARFELFIGGMELANSFSELNNPFDQADRFSQQAEARSSGDDEAHYFDHDYIKALEYGLPPTVGVGIGIDRLVMLMTNTTSIKDVILFPTMKRRAQ